MTTKIEMTLINCLTIATLIVVLITLVLAYYTVPISRWLNQVEKDLKVIEASGVKPKNLWDLYRTYRNYKKNR